MLSAVEKQVGRLNHLSQSTECMLTQYYLGKMPSHEACRGHAPHYEIDNNATLFKPGLDAIVKPQIREQTSGEAHHNVQEEYPQAFFWSVDSAYNHEECVPAYNQC